MHQTRFTIDEQHRAICVQRNNAKIQMTLLYKRKKLPPLERFKNPIRPQDILEVTRRFYRQSILLCIPYVEQQHSGRGKQGCLRRICQHRVSKMTKAEPPLTGCQ